MGAANAQPMTVDPISARFARLLHHRGQNLTKGEPVALPIVSATTFAQPGEPDGTHFYARAGTPTVEALEAELGILEDAEVVCLPSGMAAVAASLFATVKAGDQILIPSDGYYNTRKLSEQFLAPLGVRVRECATAEMAEADLTDVDVVMVETPSNPGLEVCDLAKIAKRAKTAGAITIADNTTATPLGQQPLDLGFDLSVSADTKAIAGHSDVLAGHVAGRNAERMTRVREWRTLSGAVLGPHEAYLVHRGLATLEVRLERMSANAMAVAEALAAKGVEVRYPGLSGDPSHAVATKQMRHFGPIIGVSFADKVTAEKFITDCPVLIAATGFGGVHSSAERRARWGDDVADGFVRIAVGVEPTEALVAGVLGAIA